jgi:hypothetical protein
MQRPTLTHYTGTRILPILQERERSRSWFARKLGMHPSHVHRVLLGQLPISTYFVERACAVLEMPEEALFFLDPSMQACLPAVEVA